MREQLSRHRTAIAIALAGIVAVLIAGLLFQSTTAILWVGGIVGVLCGVAIASTQKDDDPRSR